MIKVIVEHFLTEQGRDEFSNWILAVQIELKKFKGFISINELIDIQNTLRSILILEFDSYENLKVWSSSISHELMLAQLRPMMIKKQQSQIFKINLKQ